jgi:lipopolysaccharide export system protein LptA
MLFIAAVSPSDYLSAQSERFSFSGDRTTIRLEGENRRTVLKGNAKIESSTFRIEADQIELYGPEFRFIQCSGNVIMEETEKDIQLNARQLFYDRELDITRVQGYNEFLDRKNEFSARSYYLEQEGPNGRVILQTAVRIDTVSDGEAVTCRSEIARFDRESSILELLGTPVVNWKGDEYRADRIVIDTGRDSIRLEGSVTGTLTDKE